jgi:hypothetical protein
MAETWLDKLTAPEIRSFLEASKDLDEHALLLRYKTYLGVPAKILAGQIKGRRKAKEKLPHWFQTPGIVFLPSTSLEQCSSEATALYKLDRIRHFLPDNKRQRAADITGGFGVDAYYLSTAFTGTDYIEPETSVLETARHNHRLLGALNITYHGTSAENFLVQSTNLYDLIFADPSRKTANRSKAVKLQDCLPDITLLQQHIYERTSLFMLKASPLLDIKEALQQLIYIAEVNVIAVNNEVRELLFVGLKDYKDEPLIRAVNLSEKPRDEFVFTFFEEAHAEVTYSAPLGFLYEPYRSILKAGAFRLAAKRYGLKKLHPNTHLYTDDKLMDDFPGRIFRITGEITPDPKDTAQAYPEGKANIIIRNYPSTVPMLAKKLKIREGGTDYLIACTSVVKRHLLAAHRLK